MADVSKLPQVAVTLKQSDVIETLKSQGFGNKDPLTTADKFVQTVLEWLEGWLENHNTSGVDNDPPAIFVLDDEPSLGPSVPGATRALGFAQSLPRNIGGNIHCCNYNLRSVFRNKVDCVDGPEALAYIEKAGLTNTVAVVFLPDQNRVLIHRPGKDVNDCEWLRLTAPPPKPFRFEDIDDHLNTFHNESTLTIQGFCQIWHEPKTRQVKRGAEKQIQGSLCQYLKYTVGLRRTKIDQEFYTWGGRGDVAITRFSGDAFEICILELKVLRKERGANFNLKWALRGIGQVVKYRAAYPGVVDGYLCCFDARENDEEMPEVEQKALEKSVKSRRYFMTTPGCEGHLGESA